MGMLESLGLRSNGHEATLREELATERDQSSWLAENLHRLELEIAGDEDWRRMGAALRRDFTRAGLDDIVDISRAMYLAHPLIQRGVNITTYYTWAQGYEFNAEDERVQAEVVEPHLANEGNRLEIYGTQATVLTDIDQIVDGNILLALFTSDQGDVNIRSIPMDQVREIICHPQDYQQVMYYRRVWSQKEFDSSSGNTTVKMNDVLYPDIRYNPRVKPESIGGHTVMWHAPCIHQRTGGLKHQQFGIPATYSALDWARAYKKFLEDWHTVVSSLARFAWKSTSKGSKAERLKDRLRRKRAEGVESEDDSERGGPPVAGSIWADNTELTPISKSGMTTSAEDGKMARLMVASALDVPDTMLSNDPQQGALATAKSLDRPTELGIMLRQGLYNDFHARIFRYIIDAKVRRGRMPGRVVRTADGTQVEPGIDSGVKMVFPPILEHDVKETVTAVVSAATLDGKADAGTMPREEISRRLMSAIGVEDVTSALEDLSNEERDQVDAAVERLSKALEALNSV